MVVPQAGSPGPIIEADARAVAERCGDLLDRLRGKTLLITGAGGMVPSALVHSVAWLNRHRFGDSPCRLIGVECRPVEAGDPLEYLLGDPNTQILIHDAREPLPCEEHIDFFVHAASPASPKHYSRMAVETLQVNALGLNHLLERARRDGCEGFLFVSSGEICGKPPEDAVPTPETHVGPADPLTPRSCYVEGKRFGEALAFHFHRQHGVPARIVRPFQIHGPGLRLGDGRAFGDFLEAAVRGEPITVLSAGTALRTYCSLRDATVMMWHVLLAGRSGEAYNVGASEPEITILELARMIARLAGTGSRVEVFGEGAAAHTEGSPARTCPDVSKIEREFGVKPLDSLEEGFARTLAWLRERGT